MQIETLQLKNEDLELELTNTKDALTLAEATLGSLRRQVQTAEESSRENAQRAQQAEVEFQRVLLSTEEYHEARRANNIDGKPSQPETNTGAGLVLVLDGKLSETLDIVKRQQITTTRWRRRRRNVKVTIITN